VRISLGSVADFLPRIPRGQAGYMRRHHRESFDGGLGGGDRIAVGRLQDFGPESIETNPMSYEDRLAEGDLHIEDYVSPREEDASGWLPDGTSSFGPSGYRGGMAMQRAVQMISMDDAKKYGLTNAQAERAQNNLPVNRHTFPISWGAYPDDFGINKGRCPLGKKANFQYPL